MRITITWGSSVSVAPYIDAHAIVICRRRLGMASIEELWTRTVTQHQGELNSYFDILIEKTSLDEEMKNLVIYKKALFNADQADEGQLLSILNPLINSKSVWKSHALYLMAEYFYSGEQKQKAKEFFNQIISLENSNTDIRLQAEKRLNRDLSE